MDYGESPVIECFVENGVNDSVPGHSGGACYRMPNGMGSPQPTNTEIQYGSRMQIYIAP